jgi:hypothetical protein
MMNVPIYEAYRYYKVAYLNECINFVLVDLSGITKITAKS